MTTCDGVEHWDSEQLKEIIGTMDGIHESQVKLGDTLDGVKANLQSWGGLTAEAWRAYHGRVRVDVDEHGHQAKAVADKLRPLYDEVLSIRRFRHSSADSPASSGAGHIIVFGGSEPWAKNMDTMHTGIYIGNGFMINAPQSGDPVRVDAVRGHGNGDILKIPGTP